MKGSWGFLVAPSGLPWPLSAEALAALAALASGGAQAGRARHSPPKRGRGGRRPERSWSASASQSQSCSPNSCANAAPWAENPAQLSLIASCLAGLGVLFQPLRPGTRHFCDVLWRSSPIAGPAFDRVFNADSTENTAFVMRGSTACMASSGNSSRSTPLVLGGLYDRAGDVVGLAERQLEFAHQPVGEIRRRGIAAAGRGAHGLGLRFQVLDHAGHRGNGESAGWQARRSPLPYPPACPWSRRAAGPSSRCTRLWKAPAMRPTLARESSAASGLRFCGMIEEPVVNLSDSADEAELRRHPDNDLLGEPRQVDGRDGGRGERFEREVAVGDAVERVRHRPVEAQRFRRLVPVDRKRRAGKRGRAERAFVQAACARRRSGRDRARTSRRRPAGDGRT